MKIISGTANQKLAHRLATTLNIPLVNAEITKFPNGEKRVWITDKVRGENITIVQSFSEPTDEHIMEFLLLTDALERLGARHVNLIIPWLGYSLQDKVFREGEAIAVKVVADLVSHAYIKRVFLLDVHNTSIPGFFSVPTHHLTAKPLFIQYAQEHMELGNTVVASPDFGGLKRARTFANELQLDLVNIDKHRDLYSGKAQALDVHGEVVSKEVLIWDDVIVSGSTVVEAARILKEKGAKKVIFCATHGPLVPVAFEKITNSEVDEVVITNSITPAQKIEKLTVLDTCPIFVEELHDWL